MCRTTAGTLDQGKMLLIKDAILSKFPTRCCQDKDALWERCKKAIGQKCNHLRYGKWCHGIGDEEWMSIPPASEGGAEVAAAGAGIATPSVGLHGSHAVRCHSKRIE